MGSICISSATILRCSCLTQIQNIALFVPAALEFLSATCLVYYKWRSGWSHLLLTAEGWVYFLLAFLELFSVLPPLSQNGFDRFRAIDIGIGITSFLPLFLYTLFLYLFTSRDLLTPLPTYVKNVAKVILFVSLPMIIATNEVASVVALKFTFDDSGVLSSFVFSTKHDEWFWLLFTSLTLAILTAFQATVFGFAFFKFIWLFVQRGRNNIDFELRGIPWINAGVKLAALEAVLGFAGGGFEISLIRRIMRFLGRACLCIGVIKGVDSPVGPDTRSSYNDLEKTEKTRSRLSKAPSRRLTRARSTSRKFQKVGGIKGAHYLTHSQCNPLSESHSANETLRNQQRVTVLHDVHGGPPLLHMRFSRLDVPSPTLIAKDLANGSRGRLLTPEVSPTWPDGAPSSRFIGQLSRSTPSELDLDSVLTRPKLPFAHDRKASASSGVSTSTVTPSVVEIISAPRRTISQRRAEARVLRAQSIKAQVEARDGNVQMESPGTPFDTEDWMTPPPIYPAAFHVRQTSGGTFVSPEATSVVAHAGSGGQSISISSVTDSIQAVQELAGQFPDLPPSASIVDTNFMVFPGLEGGRETIRSGVFGQAIGSPSEMRYSGFPRLQSNSLVHVFEDRRASFTADQPSTGIFLPNQTTTDQVLRAQSWHPGLLHPPIPTAAPSRWSKRSDYSQASPSKSPTLEAGDLSYDEDPEYSRDQERSQEDLTVPSFSEPRHYSMVSGQGESRPYN